MDRYPLAYSRVAMGFAALTITATVFGLAVIVPASMNGRTLHWVAPARAAVKPGSIEADIVPSRIEVFAVRKPKITSLTPAAVATRSGEQG